MIVRKKSLHAWLVDDGRQELGGNVPGQQPLAVLGEDRDIPDRRIHRQADEPAKEQVVVHLLHQLAFRADRIEGLQEQGPKKFLGWDRRPPDTRIQAVEVRGQHFERFIDNRPDRAKSMVRRHPSLATHVREQPLAPFITAAHPDPFNIPLRDPGISNATSRQAPFSAAC